jgi:hypothetical protein
VINVGYIEIGVEDVLIRIYYDATFTPVGPTQPLVNGPRGYCLDISNPVGRNRGITVSTPDGITRTITIGVGDPVTGGAPAGRSRTAAQMASLGFTTRGDVQDLTLG